MSDYDPVNNPTNVGYSAIISSGSTSTLAAPVTLNDAQLSGYVVSPAATQPDTTAATIKGKNAYTSGNVDPNQVVALPISSPSLPSSYPASFSEPLWPISGYDSVPITPLGDPTGTTQTVYRVSSFSLANTDNYNVVGPVTFFVDGDFSIAGSAKITLNGKGSLALHVGGNLTIDGGGIDNQTLEPIVPGSSTLTRKPQESRDL